MADGSKGKLWTRADALAECNRVVKEYGVRVANDIVEATRKIRQIGEDSGHRAIALHAFEEMFHRIDALGQKLHPPDGKSSSPKEKLGFLTARCLDCGVVHPTHSREDLRLIGHNNPKVIDKWATCPGTGAVLRQDLYGEFDDPRFASGHGGR